MASATSMESKDTRPKLAGQSSTVISRKTKWLRTHLPFLGLLRSKQEDDSAQKQVKRRFLFEQSTVDKDGKVVLTSHDLETAEENINDVVDLDDSDLENFISTRLVPEFLCSPWFRLTVYLCIIANAIILGLETVNWFSEQYSILSQVVKELTLAVFVCEILLKWFCGFWIFWKSNWNILDFIIVGLSLIGPEFRFISCGRILRLLRACFMLRAIESIDKIGIFKGLTTIIESLLISLPDMCNIGLLLLLVLLTLAIAANNLLGEALPYLYGDLGSAFFSLFILTTQDGIIIQYKSFEPQNLYVRSVGAVFFVLTIMCGAFIFINIIVAISCYNLEVASASTAEEEQEEEEEKSAVQKDLTEDSSDDPANEFLEKFQVINKNKALKGLNLIQLQKPFQLTDFSNLTVAKLEKYLLVLSALEENLAEYEDIKKDLKELYELVKNLNLMDVANVSDATLNAGTSNLGKVRVGSATKGIKGSDHDMRQFEDVLRRTAQRLQGTVGSKTTEETNRGRRSSASSEGSEGRRRLSPAHTLHAAPKKSHE